MGQQEPPVKGAVFLVGAGPGDPLLITVRGMECLQQADVVFYDYLVNPILATWVKPGAQTICLGQHGQSRIWSQDEINAALCEQARLGRCVVRLKGGDPAIFARGAEESEFLQRQGIPFEVVPGITAALAAGSHAGIPLTHRESASAVALITGHEDPQQSKGQLDYAALARFPGTIVVYMGVTTAARWVSELIHHGLPATTPVALVRRCSFPDQQIVRCPLVEVPERLTPYTRFPPPVIAIVGAVAGQEIPSRPTASRPLLGQTILVTRPRDWSQAIARHLMRLGAGVLIQPALEIGPPQETGPVDAACHQMAEFDWIVFSSVHGVDYFLRRLWDNGYDARVLAGRRLAAIGPVTAEALGKFSLRCDLVPASFQSETLAAELAPSAKDRRFLLVRGSRGRDTLGRMLRAAGGDVTEVVAYDSRDVPAADPAVTTALEKGLIHWTMVSSSATARSLDRLFGQQLLAETRLVSISPVTSDVLRQLGHTVTAEARSYTMEGMIAAMVKESSAIRGS